MQVKPNTFHVADDTATRTSTVAYFDGVCWWLPGSEKCFTKDDFSADGRFNLRNPVTVSDSAHGGWDVRSGRHD